MSKGLNHLLKSPFCIHPKTGKQGIDHLISGKVCVPFDPTQVESFDVNRVPTLNQVIKDISAGKPTATLDPSLQIFKRFLEKIRLQKPRKFNYNVILVEKKAGGLDF